MSLLLQEVGSFTVPAVSYSIYYDISQGECSREVTPLKPKIVKSPAQV